MNQQLPELSVAAIRQQVETWRKRSPEPNLFAFYGTGDLESVALQGDESLRIVVVRSELELRARLPAIDEKVAPTAYLVPWDRAVPLDLAGRFAHSGRVISVGQTERLKALLGGVNVAGDLHRHALTKYLLRPENARKSYPAAGDYIAEEGLWLLWLRHDWGIDSEGSLGRDTLLAWAAESQRGGQFAQEMCQPTAQGVRKALDAFVGRTLGPLGVLTFRMWEGGRALELLAFGVLTEAMAAAYESQDPVVRTWIHQNLKTRFGVAVDAERERERIVRELAETTGMALRLLTSERPENTDARQKLARAAVAAADAMVDSDIRAAVSKSRRLAAAWRLRLDELGEALLKGAAAPNEAAVKLADERRRDLERHEFFRHAENIERAEMAVRLLAWLVSRQGQTVHAHGTPYADAETLANWYSKEGGYVDWARRAARSGADDRLGQGIQAVLESVDRLRAEMDQVFARALAEWHHNLRPEQHLVPIDHALARIAVPFLKEGEQPGSEQRRLLILLMDGMAWAQAVQLLHAMQGSPQQPWAPLAWHASAGHRIGSSPYPAVIANLPTITEVSRAAFFAGKPMAPGTKLDSSLDPQRFADNRQLHPFCEASVAPKLMLRDESHAKDGSASSAALELIADRRRGVVGIVINAIDASLKSDTQQQIKWELGSIKSLRAFLDAARDAGRYILFASDHGHVPADRFQSMGTPHDAGARYRRWPGEADPIQAGEQAFSGTGVYALKEAKGCVLITTDAQRYGGSAHAGEHGGATLAEVVAPCILLGWDEPGPMTLAGDLRIAPLFVPDWWHFIAAPVKAAVAKPPAAKRTQSSSQLSLAGIQPAFVAPMPTAPAAHVDSPAIATLLGSEMLKARQPRAADRETTARTLDYLIERGCRVPADVLAKYLDLAPYRVEGAVSKLTEVLNVDGYEVLRFDRQSRQVILDRVKLEQQFEVKL